MHILKSFSAIAIACILHTIPATANDSHAGPALYFNRDISSEQTFKVELKQVQKGSAVRLLVLKQEGKKVRVRLFNPDGELINSFVTTKTTSRVTRDFNFNEADTGVYTLEISDKNNSVKSQFEVKRSYGRYIRSMAIE